MERIWEVTWTWCPKCMVRTKHRQIKTAFQCLVCKCFHIGDMVFASIQEQPKPGQK